MIKVIKEHFDFTINFENVYINNDLYVYTDSTRDGYIVYVITNNMSGINIQVDVFYYDHTLAEAIIEEILAFKGKRKVKVNIDEELFDEIDFNDSLIDLFQDNVNEIIEKSEEKGYSLTASDLDWLKSENN